MKLANRKFLTIGAAIVATAGAIALLTNCGELGGVLQKKAETGGAGAGEGARGKRVINAADVQLPSGYKIEAVASELTFPTGVTFDDANRPYVVEAGYAYGEKYAPARLVRIEPDGSKKVITEDGNQPWNGVTYHNGFFYIAQGGYPGKIAKVAPNGATTIIVDGLPSKGDHHTDRPRVGPDGWVYFGLGTMTNSAVVGEDNFYYGWLGPRPFLHDVPGQDITLTGQNFKSQPVTPPLPVQAVTTGAFVPFGTSTQPGQVIKGQVPCTGSIMRVRPEGGKLELVAWGLRNPFGITFAPGGELYVTDQGYDNRGSRPIEHAPDLMFHIRKGTWYGWPDFSGGIPVSDARFRPEGKPAAQPLLAKYPNTPPKPVTRFEPHSGSMGFDFSRSGAFGHVGDAFVAQFGDAAPVTGVVKSPPGCKIVRVDVGSGSVAPFASNRGGAPGPASKIGTGGLERPVDVQFDRTGNAMYVVDFGVMTIPAIPNPRKGTGVLWRITRE